MPLPAAMIACEAACRCAACSCTRGTDSKARLLARQIFKRSKQFVSDRAIHISGMQASCQSLRTWQTQCCMLFNACCSMLFNAC